jgi:hypothetical protein
MDNNETICTECQFIKTGGRFEKPPMYAFCKANPREHREYVTGYTTIDYPFCWEINKEGHCPQYKKKVDWTTAIKYLVPSNRKA